MIAAAGFLHSIGEHPDEEGHRLVLADWLVDQGEPVAAARAELVRLQCQLGRWVPDLGDRSRLQERERDLLEQHAADWLGPLRAFCRCWRFERGLAQVSL